MIETIEAICEEGKRAVIFFFDKKTRILMTQG